MHNVLTMKLEQFCRFSPAERQRLDELLHYPRKIYVRGQAILAEGEQVQHIHLVLKGIAARSKTLADGSRKIMALLVPGDLCDLEVFVLARMDHDLRALTETTCVVIPATVIESLLSEFSTLTRALWWSTMTDSAVLREWIVNHGSRDALQRVAHVICEILIRYRLVGLAPADCFPFPMTQDELAEATGLSTVHINRTLQHLRIEGLIELKQHRLTVLDPHGLQRLGQFDGSYLHLIRTERGDADIAGRAGDLIPRRA